MSEACARAHANIALVKYWGKRDDQLNLPMNGSISMTLEQFYVTTRVSFRDALSEDQLIINDREASPLERQRVSSFLDRLRTVAGIGCHAQVVSENHVPIASGLASSAAAFAALSLAGARALGMNLPPEELSRWARQGSGSAARSIYGGFVEWLKGESPDGSDSYAIPLYPSHYWPLKAVVALVADGEKPLSSREGMKRTVQSSPFYDGWLSTVEHDLAAVRHALESRDFQQLGETAEANAFKMHATVMGAYPPFTYWSGATINILRQVQELRSEGIPAYATIDAGPHVVVLCQPFDEERVREALVRVSGVVNVVVSGIGPPAVAVEF